MDGLIGLTHRLIYAGSARVVVSLWNINDKATSIAFTSRASGIRIATIIHRPDLI